MSFKMHSTYLALLTLSFLINDVLAKHQIDKRYDHICTVKSTVTTTITVTLDSPSSTVCCSTTTTASSTITPPTLSHSVTSSTSPYASSSTYSSSSTYISTSSAVPSIQGCEYWLESIKHQGVATFNQDSSYKVFRNVKDYGAKGDGITDDTKSINAAISTGNRCGPGFCNSSSISPALVYFPSGTYLVSAPIIDYYYTQLHGNPNCMPVIKATSNFEGSWIIDGDQYQPSGAQGWLSTNVFWRQIRNFVFDTTAVNASTNIRAIHWPTGQASSLQNLVFYLSAATSTQHEGVFIEDGSGGFIADLVFYGGLYGLDVGNQQFTVRNLTFYNVQTAINQIWNWGWLYQGISIINCGTGLNMTSLNEGSHSVGSVIMIDSTFSNVGVGIATIDDGTATTGTYSSPNIVLENVRFHNVGKSLLYNSQDILGSDAYEAFAMGHIYNPSGPIVIKSRLPANNRPTSLIDSSGNWFTMSKPQYGSYPESEFLSARTAGAKGDGETDDTSALQSAIWAALRAGQVLFVDAGTYIVTKTLYVPAGSQIVGESFSVLMASGSFFADLNNPKAVVQVGVNGENGRVEWSDMMVSTKGATSGAILIEWNLATNATTPSGMWDVHVRVGGTIGSNLQVVPCLKNPSSIAINSACIAAFASMHITSTASGLYMENNWIWVADHDVDDPNETQITIYSGRGLLIDSLNGNIWLYGTAVEHHTLYQYQLANVSGPVFMGFIQTESAYYQPNPAPPAPFKSLSSWNDPMFTAGSNTTSGWGLRLVNSPQVFVYGAGLYSFFNNYNVHCSDQGNGEWCQARILSIENTSTYSIYGLETIGSKGMITVNGVDVAKFSDNLNGFADAITVMRSG